MNELKIPKGQTILKEGDTGRLENNCERYISLYHQTLRVTLSLPGSEFFIIKSGIVSVTVALLPFPFLAFKSKFHAICFSDQHSATMLSYEQQLHEGVPRKVGLRCFFPK
jgi:hypothetical protein